MAGSAVGSIIGSIGSNLAGKAIGGLMGGKKSSSGGSSGPPILPFNAGGLNVRIDPKTGIPFIDFERSIDDTASNPRFQALNSIKSSLTDQASQIRSVFDPQYKQAFGRGLSSLNEQIDLVKPGFGALTDARVSAIRDAGLSRRSDLRSNLADRRVLGSSFADDALNRLDVEVGRQEAEAKALSFLEELDTTNRLISQRTSLELDAVQTSMQNLFAASELERGAAQVDYDELNTQLQILTQLVSGATSQIGANSRLEAQLAAEAAAGRGSFAAGIGGGLGNIGNALFTGLTGSGFTGLSNGEFIGWN